MWNLLAKLDRRWMFVLTFLVIGIPLLMEIHLPQRASKMTQNVFHAIEDLPDGSRILMAMDFDPSTEGELQPMADAFVRHCAEKRHKMYFLTIWPQAVGIVQRQITKLEKEYPDYKYGEDHVNLGYRPGYEAVIDLIVSDFPGLYDADQSGTPVSQIPMMKGIKNIQQIPLIVNVSAGEPGLKEWVQLAASPYESIEIVGGTTGVQASNLYPYVPNQMIGMLAGAIPAAQYESLLLEEYSHIAELPDSSVATRFMPSQEAAHFMLVVFIILGNLSMLGSNSKRGDA
jgi:hypothetical protein